MEATHVGKGSSAEKDLEQIRKGHDAAYIEGKNSPFNHGIEF